MTDATASSRLPTDRSTSPDARHRYVGARVLRSEDPRLLRGQGRYLDDLALPGMLEVAVLRSPHAHARIAGIDGTTAAEMQGVECVVTAADLGAVNQPIPVIWQLPGLRIPPYLPLATDTVRHVGQPVAAVVARDRYIAEDALEQVLVEYEELPAVVNAEAALGSNAPRLYPEWGDNEAYRLQVTSGEPDRAFARADMVVRERFEIQRHTAVPLERRGIVARYDPHDELLTIWATVQHPHAYRMHLAPMLQLPESQIRVIVPDLGGAFGVYYEVYPEDVLVAALALRLGRPVRWIEDRREGFLTTVHARQQVHQAELAVSRDGRVLALRDRIVSDIGAYIDYSGVGPSFFTANFLTGPYDIQDVDVKLRCAVTNKVRSGGYRGFGAPQAAFVMEGLMDLAARELGLDPAELRRRNLIQPDQFPYRLASGSTMDSGNYPELLRRGLEAIDYAGFRQEQQRARAVGRLLGIGIACYVEHTGSSPSRVLARRGYEIGGWERVTVRIEPDGSIVAFSGASHMGQGIRTALAQICADELGIRPDLVRVVTGDTSTTHGNRGSVGSRSAVIAGQAMQYAAHTVREKATKIAAHLLEAAPADIEIADGQFSVAGIPGRTLDYRAIGYAASLQHLTPDGLEPGLEETASFDPPALTFASGVHLVTLEVDPRVGTVAIQRYVIVHDCGTVINPMIVEGQVMGATAQGIGGALLEELVYDESGQLLTTTLMDYLLPTAMDVPRMEIGHLETPAPYVPTGVKGVGEAGTIGPPAAVMNALADAIAPAQLVERATPFKPERLWHQLAAVRAQHV